ncbi:MAG: hypothetical protein R3B54_01815 [Bdellovibrionota bacterium]
MSEPSPKPIRSLILGGVVPVIAFTIVEEYFGILWGVVAGMVFAVGEILIEWKKQKRVSPITLGGGVMILLLGESLSPHRKGSGSSYSRLCWKAYLAQSSLFLA